MISRALLLGLRLQRGPTSTATEVTTATARMHEHTITTRRSDDARLLRHRMAERGGKRLEIHSTPSRSAQLGLDRHTFDHFHLGHSTGLRRAKLVLHLHRLDDDESLVRADRRRPPSPAP